MRLNLLFVNKFASLENFNAKESMITDSELSHIS